MAILSFIGVACLAVWSPVAAQSSVTLEGVVRDERAGPLENASITAVAVGATESRRAFTDARGEFRFLGLSSGRYTVRAQLPGYRTASETVQLGTGQRARLHFILIAEGVELAPVEVATEPLRSVEVQRTSVSTPVQVDEIENLPLNMRSVMNLAAVTPGIRSYAPDRGRSLPAAGAMPEFLINLQVDGIEMKGVYYPNVVGVPQTGSPLPAEALQEFRVLLNSYDAEFARAGGYLINAVSRRGTNTLEGSAFTFFQSKALVTQGPLQQEKPDFNRLQLGFNVRGPIRRDRLFFAASYELGRTNDFIDVVPGSDVWNSYAGTFPAPNRNHTGLLRLTYVPNQQHTVDAIWSTRYMTGESFFGGTTARDAGISQRYFVNVAQLRDRYLPNPRFLNELSLQFLSSMVDELQLVPGPSFFYPGIQIGTPGFPLKVHETHVRLVNRATWTRGTGRGSHLVRAGLELARVSLDDYRPDARDGVFAFGTDTSTLPAAAAIGLGYTNPFGDTDARGTLEGWVAGAYVNDEWRPVSNVALMLGVRWDADINTLNNRYTVPWAADSELQSLPVLQPFLNRGTRKNDLNNFAPRVFVSWDVRNNGRTYVRGGFGIVYDRVPAANGMAERRDAAWRIYFFPNPGTTDPEVLRDRVRSGAVPATPSFSLLKDKTEAPENWQVSVGLGHQITPSLGLNVDVIKQEVRHIFVAINANYYRPSTGQRALTQRFGDIVLWDDFARARFTALLTSLTYQREALRLNAAYTLSFAKSDYDFAFSPTYPFRSSYVLQRRADDERHRLVFSGIAPVPLGITLSGIITAASPRPYSAIIGVDTNDNGDWGDDWIDGVRTRSPPQEWAHWYRSVDIRLTRRFPIGGKRRIWLMAEAFNLVNWKNYSYYGARQLDDLGQPLPNFGQPAGAFAGRQVQLGSRIEF